MEQTQPALRAAGREPWIIAAYFVGTLVLGAALAPPLFWAAKSFAGWAASAGLAETPGIKFVREAIVRSDFTRVFNRAVLVAALICLWPAARALRVRRGELGLARNALPWRDLSVGFLIAAGLLLALAAGYLGTGVFVWKKTIAWPAVLKDSVVRAAGAATLEELFFRGALLGLVLRTASTRTALIFVTTVYAAVHFLQPPDRLVLREGINPGSGFWLVGEILRTFANANFLLAQFATLWLAGWILATARLRTRSLWLPIGIHAGWIFGIGFFAGIAKASKQVSRDHLLPWIGDTLKTGLVPLGALALTGAAVAWYVRRRGENAERRPMSEIRFTKRD